MLFPIIILFSLAIVYFTVKHTEPDTTAFKLLK